MRQGQDEEEEEEEYEKMEEEGEGEDFVVSLYTWCPFYLTNHVP